MTPSPKLLSAQSLRADYGLTEDSTGNTLHAIAVLRGVPLKLLASACGITYFQCQGRIRHSGRSRELMKRAKPPLKGE